MFCADLQVLKGYRGFSLGGGVAAVAGCAARGRRQRQTVRAVASRKPSAAPDRAASPHFVTWLPGRGVSRAPWAGLGSGAVGRAGRDGGGGGASPRPAAAARAPPISDFAAGGRCSRRACALGAARACRGLPCGEAIRWREREGGGRRHAAGDGKKHVDGREGKGLLDGARCAGSSECSSPDQGIIGFH